MDINEIVVCNKLLFGKIFSLVAKIINGLDLYEYFFQK